MTKLKVALRILRILLIQMVKNAGNKANLTHDYGMEQNITVVIATDIIIIIIIIIIITFLWSLTCNIKIEELRCMEL